MSFFRASLKLRTYILIVSPVLIFMLWSNFELLNTIETDLNKNQILVQSELASFLAEKLSGQSAYLSKKYPDSVQKNVRIHTLTSPINLDGRTEDWKNQFDEARDFDYVGVGSSFKAIAGLQQNILNIGVSVADRHPVLYRRTEEEAPTERIVLRLFGDNGKEHGIEVLPRRGGGVDFIHSGPVQASGRFRGSVRLTDFGYVVEIALPADIAGDGPSLEIAVLNTDPASEEASHALPVSDKTGFYLPESISTELQNFLAADDRYSDYSYIVLDKNLVVRGRVESNTDSSLLPEKLYIRYIRKFIEFVQLRISKAAGVERNTDYPEVATKLARRTFDTGSSAYTSAIIGDNSKAILAAHPIVQDKAVTGAVIVAKSTGALLFLPTHIPSLIFLTSVVTLAGVFLLALIIVRFVAVRLQRLGQAAGHSIDQFGRFKQTQLSREMSSRDEIGDLARNISSILSRLHQHNQFLERMPRTLRHEINNPLNVVSTSLQNLAKENLSIGDSKYMEIARRGVDRIGSIVQYLSDAVSLEESLKAEDQEILDIGLLLENYVANCRIIRKDIVFEYQGPRHPIYAQVSDYRIEQLMDKVIANAVDFYTEGTKIQIQLTTVREKLQIIVTNQGPPLPSGIESSLFDSMVTVRSLFEGGSLHFGLGLYVVRVIAEHHGGEAAAENLVDNGGVRIIVTLPRAAIHNVIRELHSQPDTGTEGRASARLS